MEKPFTPTSAEADELIAIAKSCRRLLTVYQSTLPSFLSSPPLRLHIFPLSPHIPSLKNSNYQIPGPKKKDRRWDSDFLTLSKLLDTAVLGRIVEFETHFDRYRPQASPTGWKSQVLPGGGVVYDLGSHLIDQVVLRFGLPQRITGFVGSQREGTGSGPKGYEDSCTILLHYGGMLATVKAAVVSLEVEQLRFWVRGEGGSYKKVGFFFFLVFLCFFMDSDPSSREREICIKLTRWRFPSYIYLVPFRSSRRPTQSRKKTLRSRIWHRARRKTRFVLPFPPPYLPNSMSTHPPTCCPFFHLFLPPFPPFSSPPNISSPPFRHQKQEL